jgi:triacylglycerol lipase
LIVSHLIRRKHLLKQLLLPAARLLCATLAFGVFPGIALRAETSNADIQVRVTRLAAQVQAAPEGGMTASIAAALREIGPKIDGARTAALYTPLQPTEPYSNVTVTRDVHYGPHERHVLDIFTGGAASGERSVVVFIHGGGFTRGAKHTAGSPFYDNVGVWAARHGLVGVTINYRLAPEFQWPSGVEDLTLLTGWLKTHVSTYGGDPARIYLWGHSAGAAHVADYLAHAVQAGTDPGIAGAILTSGFYVLGDQVSIWKDYYGVDVSQYTARASLPSLLKTATPLLVTYAELDPESFQSDSRALIEARARAGKPVRSVRLVGHSHISETYAVGTGDESLSGPVLDFIHDAGKSGHGG